MIPAFINRFLHWSVVGVISPVLVLMIMSKGVGLELVGVAMALLSLTVFALELPSGVLSDMIGRKRVYLVSIAVAACGYALMLFVDKVIGVCVALALYGASRAFSSGSIEAHYIDSFIARYGKDKLPALVSVMNAGETLGLALGALAGGILPSLWRKLFPWANPYNGNLVVQIVILAALFALSAGTAREADSGRAPKSADSGRFKTVLRESSRAIRGDRIIPALLAGAVFWGATFSAIELYWQPRLESLLADTDSSWLFGVINSAYFASALAGNLLIGLLMRRLKPGSGMVVIAVLRIASGGAIIALALQGSVIGFCTLYLAAMCCNGMMTIPETSALNAAIPETARASLLSLASLSAQAGGLAASLAFSAMLHFASIGGVWIVAGIMLAGSSLLYVQSFSSRPIAKGHDKA